MKEKLAFMFIPCIILVSMLLIVGGCAKKQQVPTEEPVPAPVVTEPEVEAAPAPEAPAVGLEDIHFDFDKYNIRPDARAVLSKNYEILKEMASAKVLIEGHCDERGTEEYNMALGQRRADSTKDYLVSLGMDAGQLSAVSYGEGKPLCTEQGEACWSQNRRAHFVVSE